MAEYDRFLESGIPLPNLFLVGAPKCGTTSLHNYLAQVPGIYMSPKKEPHFWSTDLYRPKRITAEEYFNLFRNGDGHALIGESSTEYIYSRAACDQIHEYFPDARIIIMLRNPVDKLYSGHSHRVWRGWEEITDFAEALKAKRTAQSSPHSGQERVLLPYRETVKYAKYVKMYLDRFGLDQVQVVIFEEFLADPMGQFPAICDFLEVRLDRAVDFSQHNARKANRVQLLAKLFGSASEFRRIAQTLPPTAQAIPKQILRRIERWNTRYERTEPMHGSLRSALERELIGEVEALGALLKRDLTSVWFAGDERAIGVNAN